MSSEAARVSSRRLGNGEEPHSLEDVLTRILEIEKKGDDEGGVSVANIVDAVGRRSFGPFLLVPGVVMLSPLSGIPTLPTVCASFVALVAVQMLSGRRCLWLPDRIAGLSVNPNRLARAMEFLLPVARFADRLFKPRLLALTVPFLEVLPFASSATRVGNEGVAVRPMVSGQAARTDSGVKRRVPRAGFVKNKILRFGWHHSATHQFPKQHLRANQLSDHMQADPKPAAFQCITPYGPTRPDRA